MSELKRYGSVTRGLWRLQFRNWKWLRERTTVRLSVKDWQKVLCAYGFPVGAVDGVAGVRTGLALQRFQEAYNGGLTLSPLLTVDGVLGPKTEAALWELPYLSKHFTALEVASKGNGDAYVKRELLAELERLRSDLRRPLYLVSCYRDPAHNVRVGGATRSRHLYGEAADFSRSYSYSLQQAKATKRWGGIGALRTSKRVTHVDIRPGNRDRPSVWFYPE